MTTPTTTDTIIRAQSRFDEQMAYVWTLKSQARVGSYQHLVSSVPWMILAAEESQLRAIHREASNG